MPSSPVEETNNGNMTAAERGHPRTDEELVAAAKSGDELAFEMLMKRYWSCILTVALRYTRIREDAEDVVQQTFQKVFVYLHKFQGKSSFSTWLTRIVINEALMFLRRGRAKREISIEDTRSEDVGSREEEIVDSSPNPEMNYLQQESVHILFSAMAQLRPGLRVAVELKELRDLSCSDTARHMGVSVGTVKARVFRGRRELRKILTHSTPCPLRSGRTFLGKRNRHRRSQNRLERLSNPHCCD